MSEKLNILILAAGLGKRMKSQKPKILFDLLGKPILGYILQTVKNIKNDKIIVLVGNKAEEVEGYLKDKNVTIAYQKSQLGTGDAVKSAFEKFDERSSVMVLAGDVPLITEKTLTSLYLSHQNNNNDITFITMELDNPYGYGRVVRDRSGKIKNIVEEKDADEDEKRIKEVNSGLYIFKYDFLKNNLHLLSNDNNQKEYYLTDLIKLGYMKNAKIETVKINDPSEVTGINDREQLSMTETLLLKRKISSLLKNGITIKSPETVYIEYDVSFETDILIEPFVIIKGRSIIRKGTKISSFCYLENFETEEYQHIPPYSNLIK